MNIPPFIMNYNNETCPCPEVYGRMREIYNKILRSEKKIKKMDINLPTIDITPIVKYYNDIIVIYNTLVEILGNGINKIYKNNDIDVDKMLIQKYEIGISVTYPFKEVLELIKKIKSNAESLMNTVDDLIKTSSVLNTIKSVSEIFKDIKINMAKKGIDVDKLYGPNFFNDIINQKHVHKGGGLLTDMQIKIETIKNKLGLLKNTDVLDKQQILKHHSKFESVEKALEEMNKLKTKIETLNDQIPLKYFDIDINDNIPVDVIGKITEELHKPEDYKVQLDGDNDDTKVLEYMDTILQKTEIYKNLSSEIQHKIQLYELKHFELQQIKKILYTSTNIKIIPNDRNIEDYITVMNEIHELSKKKYNIHNIVKIYKNIYDVLQQNPSEQRMIKNIVNSYSKFIKMILYIYKLYKSMYVYLSEQSVRNNELIINIEENNKILNAYNKDYQNITINNIENINNFIEVALNCVNIYNSITESLKIIKNKEIETKINEKMRIINDNITIITSNIKQISMDPKLNNYIDLLYTNIQNKIQQIPNDSNFKIKRLQIIMGLDSNVTFNNHIIENASYKENIIKYIELYRQYVTITNKLKDLNTENEIIINTITVKKNIILEKLNKIMLPVITSEQLDIIIMNITLYSSQLSEILPIYKNSDIYKNMLSKISEDIDLYYVLTRENVDQKTTYYNREISIKDIQISNIYTRNPEIITYVKEIILSKSSTSTNLDRIFKKYAKNNRKITNIITMYAYDFPINIKLLELPNITSDKWYLRTGTLEGGGTYKKNVNKIYRGGADISTEVPSDIIEYIGNNNELYNQIHENMQNMAMVINKFKSIVQEYITIQIQTLHENLLGIHHVFYIITVFQEILENKFYPEIYMSYTSFQNRCGVINKSNVPILVVTVERLKNLCKFIDDEFKTKQTSFLMLENTESFVDILLFIHFSDNFK